MSEKSKKRSNVNDALSKLEQFLSLPIENDRDKAGIIQAFEFTYETLWKCLQELAEEEGISTASPRSAFKAGFKMDLITKEEDTVFGGIIKFRNLTSHTYDKKTADIVLGGIIKTYLPVFKKVVERINKFYDKKV